MHHEPNLIILVFYTCGAHENRMVFDSGIVCAQYASFIHVYCIYIYMYTTSSVYNVYTYMHVLRPWQSQIEHEKRGNKSLISKCGGKYGR